MGEAEIPFLKFSSVILELEQESEEWKGMCCKVREACEMHGFFILECEDKIPRNLYLCEDMFMSMNTLFDLPKETKEKYKSPRPFNGYSGNSPNSPLYESFGIDDVQLLHAAEAFTKLMWPEGNPSFCGVINSMSAKMQELNFIVLKMIQASFGMRKYNDSDVENSSYSLFRFMKYNVPPNNESALGLGAHTDKNSLSILCSNEVQGLEVLSKEGNWIQVMPPKGSFIVFVGDILKAWSNGRLHAAKHRVIMSGAGGGGGNGNKDRYSCGLFAMPKEGVRIEAPQEFVDKDHPLLYRPFYYTDYMSYFVSYLRSNGQGDDALEVYAGLKYIMS